MTRSGKAVRASSSEPFGERLCGRDEPPALRHRVRRGVRLTWQGEKGATPTHVGPPQEQPPAPTCEYNNNGGEKNTLHKECLDKLKLT